ncbi:MAG: hypothetical protein ICV83_34130 [Cytophagales bacterium]|nr:hypothetical protein [Cytophagales bacterium]
MKRPRLTPAFVLLFALLCGTARAQTSPQPLAGSAPRVAFMLKNNLGYHRMFLVEGPGIAYGFTMGRRETTPKNWPVGSTLYFSPDGVKRGELIFTLTAGDAGKTLLTFPDEASPGGRAATREARLVSAPRTEAKTVTLHFRNNRIGFRKVALISYAPGETGNDASVFTLAPYASTRRSFPAGTRIYFADGKQVDQVMSGKSINGQKPFLVVAPEDHGETFDIFE